MGTVNFTAWPAWSRFPTACELSHSSVRRSVAWYAYNTAGWHPGGSDPQYCPLSKAQTMPLPAPFDHTDGLGTGNRDPFAAWEDGMLLNFPVAGSKAYWLSAPPPVGSATSLTAGEGMPKTEYPLRLTRREE